MIQVGEEERLGRNDLREKEIEEIVETEETGSVLRYLVQFQLGL